MRARLSLIAILLAPAICNADALKVPAVENLPYDQVKQALVSAGWVPATDVVQEENDYSAQAYAKENGFHEVEECTGSGLLQCSFVFVDPSSSDRLRVTGLGEEMPRVSTVERFTQAQETVKKSEQPTDMVGAYFDGLPAISRKLYDNMTVQYSRYFSHLLATSAADFEVKADRFCYSQTLNAAGQQSQILNQMRIAGVNASNELQRMLKFSESTRQQLLRQGKVEEALLVDVADSGMMFAAYGRILGDRFTSAVSKSCEIAIDQTKAEVARPSSDLAYKAN